MMKTTEVIKTTTGEILVFNGLSPEQAVRSAFVREVLHGMVELPEASLATCSVKRDGNQVYLGDYVSFVG